MKDVLQYAKMSYNWVAMLGEIRVDGNNLVFKGKTEKAPQGDTVFAIGNFLCNEKFSGGTISADIEFTKISQNTACEIILFYYFDPVTKTERFISAGLGSALETMFSIRDYNISRSGWNWVASRGNRQNLEADRKYALKVSLRGSLLVLNINGVDTLSTTLTPLPKSHVGVWCSESDGGEIRISNFEVKDEPPKAFVIRQFSSPFNEIYADVIKKICDEEFKLDVYAADDTYGPGLIIADIARQIIESKLIIADITPSNPNVFYEVGFAHALNKPTILLAEKGTKLPFDVSGFRTLFYEDSISGKSKIEDGLRKHIEAILTQWEWK